MVSIWMTATLSDGTTSKVSHISVCEIGERECHGSQVIIPDCESIKIDEWYPYWINARPVATCKKYKGKSVTKNPYLIKVEWQERSRCIWVKLKGPLTTSWLDCEQWRKIKE